MVSMTRRAWLGMSMATGIGFASPALAMHQLIPPPGQWKLRRSIARELADGAFITIVREWRVAFQPDPLSAGGLQLQGEEIAVEVDAPPALAPFAELERGRTVSGLFPIRLSPSGLILTTGALSACDQVAKAVALAESAFAQRGASQVRREQLRQYMVQIQSQAQPLLETLPPDLLHPAGGTIETVQPVNLPGGETGEFRLEYWARSQADCGWLDEAQRLITTTIGGSTRVSRETWALLPI